MNNSNFAKVNGFQFDINGLRGISVLLVVLYHFNLSVFGGGFIGVDLFFVISGYLMTKIAVSGIAQHKFNYFDFVLKRAQRIFPALFFALLILYLFGAAFLTPSDLNSLSDQTLQSVIFNSNNYFASKQGYFNANVDDRWLLHTWSLSVEWQFYMIYPLIIWAFMKLNNKFQPNSMLIFHLLFVITMAASFLLCITTDNQTAFFSVLTRAWQMMAGGGVYLLIVTGNAPKKYNAVVSYLGLAGIALSAYVVEHYNLESLWPGYWSAMPVVAACILLIARDQDNLILANGFMQAIGKWSYSIYLWHWPIVITLGITGVLYEAPKLSKVLGVLVSIVLGYLSYRFIESATFTRITSKRRGSLKLAGAAVLLLLLSVSVVKSEGYLFRFDDPQFFKNLEKSQVGVTYPDECENRGLAKDKFCYLNKTAQGNKILVMGDSHAGHIYPWFEHNSKFNTTFYVKSGCPLLPGFERVGKNKGCADFAKHAQELAESGTYQTVVISQNWAGFSKNSTGICAITNDGCVPLKISSNPMLSVEKARESIQAILDKGVHVVVLDSTPNYDFNVPKELARHKLWHGEVRKFYNAEKFFQETADFDAMFRGLTANPNFKLLSLRPELCDGINCRIFDTHHNSPIYRDRDHLTPSWMIENGGIFSTIN